MNTSSKRQVGRHAMVLGGSLAGLLAARVLSDHFDEVTLIERDAYTETTEVHGSGLMTKFMHRYMNHVVELATESVAVRHVLVRAFSMLVPPTALFHPRLSLRVLAHIFKERKLNGPKGVIHSTETPQGLLLICPHSLTV